MYFSARQRGSALLVSLVFLLLLTMIGISSIQDSTLQERMAGNNRDQGVAFQSAEAGLRAAERFLIDNVAVVGGLFNNSNGLYSANSGSLPDWRSSDAGSRSLWRSLPSGSLAGVDSPPEYVIEELPASPIGSGGSMAADEVVDTVGVVYRITARGYGFSPESRVVLQSNYRL